MWTWSFNAHGPKNSARNEIAAFAIATEEVAGDGTVTPIVRSQGELDQFALAKAEALVRIDKTVTGGGCSVGCSGNASVYSLSVKQIGDPSSNVTDLVIALHNAQEQGGLERDASALASLKQLTADTDAAIAAKGK